MMFPLGKSDYCFFSFCAGSPRLVVLLQSLPLTSYCFLLVCVCVCVCVCVKERERERDSEHLPMKAHVFLTSLSIYLLMEIYVASMSWLL